MPNAEFNFPDWQHQSSIDVSFTARNGNIIGVRNYRGCHPWLGLLSRCHSRLDVHQLNRCITDGANCSAALQPIQSLTGQRNSRVVEVWWAKRRPAAQELVFSRCLSASIFFIISSPALIPLKDNGAFGD